MKQHGFTMLELMIVVAIIAVLAALALPAYQDYVVRSQVAEGFSLSTGAKEAIATYYSDHGRFPADNLAAGMASPTSVNGAYVRSVTVGAAGDIVVEFSSSASNKIAGQVLMLAATDSNGSINWSCGGLDGKFLPSSCR
jgi:type IV pilus assembly protein PilA